MAEKLIILEITFWREALAHGHDQVYECTNYEVRPDERDTLVLSMFIRDSAGLFIEGKHVTRVVAIDAKAINFDKYKQVEVPSTATVN